MRQNIFSSLGWWASAQPENFLTESFARVLEVLRDDAPEEFSRVVVGLTDGAIRLSHSTVSEIRIASQVQADKLNYPDLEIAGEGFTLWLEIKDSSQMDVGQLRRYSELLAKKQYTQVALVFLSRWRTPLPSLPGLKPPVSWTQVTDWLNEIDWSNRQKSIAHYLVGEFTGFLGGKGMSVEQVGWELQRGLPALVNIREMIREALEALGAKKPWAASGYTYSGYSVTGKNVKKQVLYCVVSYNRPDEVRLLVTESLLTDTTKPQWDRHDTPGFMKKSLMFNREDVHFFVRSADSQRTCIEAFISSQLKLSGLDLRLGLTVRGGAHVPSLGDPPVEVSP